MNSAMLRHLLIAGIHREYAKDFTGSGDSADESTHSSEPN